MPVFGRKEYAKPAAPRFVPPITYYNIAALGGGSPVPRVMLLLMPIKMASGSELMDAGSGITVSALWLIDSRFGMMLSALAAVVILCASDANTCAMNLSQGTLSPRLVCNSF